MAKPDPSKQEAQRQTEQREAARVEAARLEAARVHGLDNGSVVVAEYRSDGVVAATGGPYRNRYVTVFELDPGGRVRR